MATLGQRIPSGTLGGGAWMLVVIQRNLPGESAIDLSICSEISYDEDFHVTPAEVIGFLGPITYDSQGYTCQLTMGLYVKRPSSFDITLPWKDIARIFPIRSDILADGYLVENTITIVDIAATGGDPLSEFVGCVLSTNGVQVRPNSYITRNARFYAVERTI